MSRRLRHSILYVLTLVFLLAVHWIQTGSQLGEQIARTAWGLNLQHYSRLIVQLGARTHRAVEREALESMEQEQEVAPQVSHASGFYADGLRVDIIAAQPGSILRYTLDGSVPSRSSLQFEEPLEISKTTVLRVRGYGKSRYPSHILTFTYIVDELWGVPAVSLVLDPVFLYDKHAGIYTHAQKKGREWERPAEFAIMNDDGDLLEAEVRLRIHGNASRGGHPKNFRIYLSHEHADLKSWFGSKRDLIADSQSEWVLKRASNSRQLYSDRLASRIASQLRLAVGPRIATVLYVNGELWSAFDLSERINPEFAAGKVEGTSFTMLHGDPLTYPVRNPYDAAGWKDLYKFIAEENLEREENFAVVEKEFNIDNLIDYFALSIFMADGDRPQGNIDMFRGNEPGSRWFFGVWDFDGGVNYMGSYTHHDTMFWHLRPGVARDLKLYGVVDNESLVSSTTLLRALMTNQGFRLRFRTRFEDLLTTVLSEENLLSTLESLLADYKSIVPIERGPFERGELWGEAISYEDRVEEIRAFLSSRPGVVRSQLDRQIPH
jgi:hypothetical protein